MDILFSNVTCVTMDAEMHVYPNAFVGVTGGKISHVGKAAPEEQPAQIIDEILRAIPSIAPIAPELVSESSLLRKEFL